MSDFNDEVNEVVATTEEETAVAVAVAEREMVEETIAPDDVAELSADIEEEAEEALAEEEEEIDPELAEFRRAMSLSAWNLTMNHGRVCVTHLVLQVLLVTHTTQVRSLLMKQNPCLHLVH